MTMWIEERYRLLKRRFQTADSGGVGRVRLEASRPDG